MAWKFNIFTLNLDYYEAGGTGGGTGGDPLTLTHVANFSALPDPTTVGLYDVFIVDNAQGTKWLPGSLGGNYYPAGAYYSNLIKWVYSESAGQATQAEVNTGTVTDKFVTPDTLNNYSGWTKSKVGLSDVNNTSDIDKPISTATQTALDVITNINWLGDYDNGYTYTVGDGVMFNGASFRMYNAIGAAGYPPSAYPGNWKQITEYVSANDIGLGNVDNTSDADKPISTATQTALDLKADLVGGTVPSSQLPSYVDDVIEGYYSTGVFYSDAGLTTAIVPTTGKIYVDLLQNKSYRWSGSIYVPISNPISSIDELTDVTIASVTNGQLLQYNITTSQWENKTITLGNGDMQKSVYDIDNDGIVDYAETISITVRNPSVSDILRKGTIVYLSGSTGNRPNAYKAQANAESTSSGTFGAVVADIGLNSDGEVAALGTLHNLDTRTLALGNPYPFTLDTLIDGDVLWLDPNNAGYVTKTKPQAPNHIVFIGVVARTSPTFGRIIYRIANGFELEELHNVFINGTLANNHTLYYDSATSLWKTNSIPTVLGYTPANKAGDTFTGSISATNLSGTNTGDQDLSNLVVKNTAITGATKTKITYDAKGLVTDGADATTADIADSLNKRYTTDAQQTLLGNTSNTNTGDETNATIKTKLGVATTSLDGYLTATDWNTFYNKGNGTVTSVGLTMPAAFTVTNSPIVNSGDIAVASAGIASQYIRGDGTLATFPTTTGGGSSVAYYFNGGTSQGTIGGSAYYEMSKDAVIGTEVNFTLTNTTGYIAQFITDISDPSLLSIPQGAWNFSLYFSSSAPNNSGSFYVELYKYDGTTFTLISSSSATPEIITNGTAIDLYNTSTAVPSTNLVVTDRLAVRVFVNTNGNKTITLHTENSHLCEVITTFSTGINTLNSLSAQTQYFATGTTGTDFNVSSTTDTHTFNLPTASATNRGALSSANWSTFNSKVGGSGTTNYLPKFTASSTIGNSQIADNGTGVGIGITPDSTYKLYVHSYNTTIFSQSVFGNAVHGNGNIGVFGEGNTGMKANGINVGIEANAGQTDEFGVISETIGGIFNGNAFFGGSPAYSVQLQDGTQEINKFLKSVTADGKANWATLSATSPLSYNSGTDVFSIQVANATQDGYLSSSDWNTFNSAAPPFIPSLIGNETYRGISINNNSTTVISDGGVVMSSSASTLAQAVSSTNFATKQIRLRYYASTVSGGRYTGTRGSALLWYIHGGFKFVCDFNISDTSYSAGCQQFYGLAGQITDLAYGTASNILVSTLLNIIGVGNETGDANLQVFHNDGTGTATKVDLGVGFPANRTAGAISTTVYSIKLYNECMSTDVKYEVKNNETGDIANGTISANLPLTSQGLNLYASRCMSATSVTNTGQFDLSKLGVYSLL
jgi:hypothetical protein